MKAHDKLLRKQLGNPLAGKYWYLLADLLRYAAEDVAYNHPSNVSCEFADEDIKIFRAAMSRAYSYHEEVMKTSNSRSERCHENFKFQK